MIQGRDISKVLAGAGDPSSAPSSVTGMQAIAAAMAYTGSPAFAQGAPEQVSGLTAAWQNLGAQKSQQQPQAQPGMMDTMGPALVQAGGQVIGAVGNAVSQRAAEKRLDARTAADRARRNTNIGTKLY